MALIRQKLAEERFVSVAAVAEEMGVSQMTARRDLARLERMNLAIRTHGGAVAPGRLGVALDTREPAFDARASKAEHAKKKIAAAAAALTSPGQTVGLDVGTTALELATCIGKVGGLSIFTNSLRAGVGLAGTSNHIYMIGGEVRADELSLHGSIGLAQIRQLWFDHAFVGVSGVTEDGYYDFSIEEAEMKRAFVERARNVVVLCDSTKFERMSLVRVCPLGAAHVFVTDREPPAPLRAGIEAGGAEILIAPG